MIFETGVIGKSYHWIQIAMYILIVKLFNEGINVLEYFHSLAIYSFTLMELQIS